MAAAMAAAMGVAHQRVTAISRMEAARQRWRKAYALQHQRHPCSRGDVTSESVIIVAKNVA